MEFNSFSLDVSRLDKVRQNGNKTIARCPACAEHEGDRKGTHLAIFPSGAFVCAAFPGDKEHSSRIRALVGSIGPRVGHPVSREQFAIDQRRGKVRKHLIATIAAKRAKIISRHPWPLEDVWESSPQRIDCPLVNSDPRHFLASLFPENALVWSGDVFESGARHGHHWRTVADWQNASLTEIGPMTTPAIWKKGKPNRTEENVLSRPFVILDFDGFDGKKPETATELEKHRNDSLAIIRWIREGLHWQLAAIIWTGSKSMHAWFHTPSPTVFVQRQL